jgi:drug/metabolite transporter (DMT)-like permease
MKFSDPSAKNSGTQEIRDPSAPSPAVNPYLILIFAVMAVSTGAIFARLADAPALVIAAYRVGIASAVIVPIAIWKSRQEIRMLSRRDMLLSFLAGLFLALHFATWISSLDYTSVANSVVLVNTNPVWVALLTPFITRERIQSRVIVSILASVTGGIIIGAADFKLGADSLRGDGLALIGSFCAAAYLLLGRNLRQKLSLIAYIAVCYGCAAVILWLLVLAWGLPITGFDTGTVGALVAMALIPQLIGHSSYNWALRWFSTSFIAVSLLGEPIISTILAYIIFNEGLSVSKIVGGAFILCGIYIAASGQKR